MARGTFNRDEVKATKAQLPDVEEVFGDESTVTQLITLMQEAKMLKEILDPKLAGSAAARYEEVKTELAAVQIGAGLEGLRHQGIAFTARMQDGRSTVDHKKRDQYLLLHGVKAEVLMEATKESTKTGEGFWVKSVDILDKEKD